MNRMTRRSFKMSFEEWKKHANNVCEREYGLSLDDLADCPYADWHANGVTPQRAAKRAICNAKEG